MKTSDFDFNLPKDLLAEFPTTKRDSSKLMVINRKNETISHHHFHEIHNFFNPEDLLIRNSTKVKPVRFLAKKEHLKGAKLEVLLLKNIDARKWEAFIDPLVKVKVGSKVIFGEGIIIAEIVEIVQQRSVILNFIYPSNTDELETYLKHLGTMPLPRYIKRLPNATDFERYQTVYAKEETALAAPTSGLHFTQNLFNKIVSKGVTISDLNLEIGLGTFNPVYKEELNQHKMHSEKFHISNETAKTINHQKESGNRIIALGTTSIRSTEAAFENGKIKSGDFNTSIFIHPPYSFNVANALITNFHTPRSTLLMLVCAFGGYDLIMHAYQEAIKNNYRFYSYGDSMMII
jgi:S-adenosylmethionine:tRNA ribosyltransferase-isomerase